EWSDTRESWLARAARRLGIEPGRAASLFYRKARAIRADEYLTLRARVAALKEAAIRRQEAIDALENQVVALDRGDLRPLEPRRDVEGAEAVVQAGEPR